MAASMRLGKAADPERQARLVDAIQSAHLDAVLCASASEVLLLSGYWPVMAQSIAVAAADGSVTVLLPEEDSHIHEELVEVHILLVVHTDQIAEGMAGDGKHGLLVALRVVEAIEQMTSW